MINKTENGYSISQLFNAENTQILKDIYLVNENAPMEITYFEIPNINTHIYQVKKQESVLYYTNYNGRFNSRQGVQLSDLMPTLTQDAATFQEKFGEAVKKSQLVY